MIGAVVALRGAYELPWVSIVLLVLAIPLVALHSAVGPSDSGCSSSPS